ncbi:MAG: alpha/beta hydrolase [Rhodothermaceae bacterium]|nr:alpha/beta hydrolase [Rhodothermaceae bacterium]
MPGFAFSNKYVALFLLMSLGLSNSLIAQEVVHMEEVRIEGPEVTLAGSLYTPEFCTSGCPGIVFLGGGSADTRQNQIPFAERFAKKGIVSLIFDKRGAGESTGDYDSRTFDNLADDAVTAFHYLANRAETDAAKTGLWGGSEGGSVALMAAARTTGVGYIVNLAGPVQFFQEGYMYELAASLGENETSNEYRESLLQLWKHYFEDAKDGAIGAEVLADIKQWQSKADNIHIPPDTTAYPPEPDPHPRSFWYLHRLTIFEHLDMPVLMVFGELDEAVPPGINTSIVETAFETLGKSNYEIHVFPRASHAFTTLEGQLVSGFFEIQIDWVLDQVL